jgi:hypothetical protein
MNEAISAPCDNRRVIAAHFAGRGSPAADGAMRAHLGGCLPCRRYYDRELMLASLDPRGRKAEERIARGLGLRTGVSSPRRLAAWMAAGVLVPATAGLLLFAHRGELPRPPGAAREELTPRGAPAAAQEATAPVPAPSVWIYRVARDGSVRLAEGAIQADDELAFAYSNTAGRSFLLIFGVDEHRHVYWYHPAWRVGEPPPSAVRASPGPGPFELPEAVRHHPDGRQLTIYALLSRQRIDVQAIETAIRRAGAAGLLPATFGTERPAVVGRSFVVQP